MSIAINRVGCSWWYPALLAASALLYLGQVALFRRLGETVQVLLDTFVLNAPIARRGKRRLLAKPYTVIAAFYSQVGNRLLELLLAPDPEREQLRCGFLGVKNCSEAELKRLWASFAGSGQDSTACYVIGAAAHPAGRRAGFSSGALTEELSYRSDLTTLPQSDLAHLAGDVAGGDIFSLVTRLQPFQVKPDAIVGRSTG